MKMTDEEIFGIGGESLSKEVEKLWKTKEKYQVPKSQIPSKFV